MINETKYKVLLMAGLPTVKELDGKVVNQCNFLIGRFIIILLRIIYNVTHKSFVSSRMKKISMILFLKLLIFICGFSAKVTCAFLFILSYGEIHRNKHYSSRKNKVIFNPIPAGVPENQDMLGGGQFAPPL